MAVIDTTSTDTLAVVEMQSQAAVAKAANNEVVCETCECCGLTEECTPAYVVTVRERNQGRWICGLCTEAVKDEMGSDELIGKEEALDRHMNFCREFQSSSPPPKPTEDLITAMKQLLLRSLDSPRSTPPASPLMMRKEGSAAAYSRSQSLNVRSGSTCCSSMDR